MVHSKSSIYPFLGIAVLVNIALGLAFFQSKSPFVISSQDNTGISVTLTQNTISVKAKKPIVSKKNKNVIKNNIKTNNHSIDNILENKQASESQTIKNIDSSAKIISSIKDEIKHIKNILGYFQEKKQVELINKINELLEELEKELEF